MRTAAPRHDRDDWRRLDLAPLVGGIAVLGLVVFAYVRLLHVTDETTVALTLLLIVLVVAAVGTLRAAVVISLIAVAAFNFFFLEPVGSWTIADPQNWVALSALLVVSIVASRLSAEARRRTREATARRDELARLFDLTRDILLTPDSGAALPFVARFIVRRFGFERATIAMPADGWTLHQSREPGLEFDAAVLDEALARARAGLEFDAQQRTYVGHVHTTDKNGADVWVVPLRVGTDPIGLLALEGGDVEPGARDAIAGVTAVAIERTRLLAERREAEIVRRNADLRATLLASLSHDLRTPLTAVTVAASNLTASWLDESERRDQAALIVSELARLNRLFENIVEMARIETHAVSAEREWVQPSEIIEAAMRQVEPALAQHPVKIDGVDLGTLVFVDPRLTSTALAHLIENAAQYSSAGSPIHLNVSTSSDGLRLSVHDAGDGIAAQDLPHLFDRFYRGSSASKHVFGTGMGLAITRGLIAAESGRVWAENHSERGAVFTIAVPADVRTTSGEDGETA